MYLRNELREVHSRVVIWATLAPWLAITAGGTGAFAIWLLALGGRRGLEALVATDPKVAGLIGHGARALYWSGAFPAAILLLLVPMAVWGRAYAGRPWPAGVAVLASGLCALAALLLFEGRPRDAAMLVGFSGFLSGTLTRFLRPSEEPSPFVVFGPALLVALPVVRALFFADPRWLRGLPIPATSPGMLLAGGLPWFAVLLAGPRVFHAARAGRWDPPHTWLIPVALMVPDPASVDRPEQRIAGVAFALTAFLAVARAGRALEAPRPTVWAIPLAAVAVYLSLYAAVLMPVLAVDRFGAVVGGVLAGLISAAAVTLLQVGRLSGAALFEGDRGAWRAWLSAPVRLARVAAPTGRALALLEAYIAGLLAHRAKHPALPYPALRWPYGADEQGALAPLVQMLTPEPSPGVGPAPDSASVGADAALGELRPLRWLARPDTLLDDLAEAPLAIRQQVTNLAFADSSPSRRFAWECLQVRLDLHVGRIDAAVAALERLVISVSSGRLAAELHAGSLLDVLRGAGGPFTEVTRPRLASSGALVELLGFAAEELARVHALALAARDPAALRFLDESRASVETLRLRLLPTAATPVEVADRVASRAQLLLERAWERRTAIIPRPVEPLLDDILATWWEEGLVPVLARAPGEPRVASLVAVAWWAAVRRHVAAAPTCRGPEDWWAALRRRLDRADRLPCTVRAADWRERLLDEQGAPGRADAAGAETAAAPPPSAVPPFRHPSARTPVPALVGGIFEDDLLPGAGAVRAAVDLSRDDLLRAPLVPLARALFGLVPSMAAVADGLAASWIPARWRASPRALLTLWEAASLAVVDVPEGPGEAARLDAQRRWLAERVGNADDRALIARDARGPGLVARRVRAEEIERALWRAEEPRDFLALVELLGRGPPCDGRLAALPDGDAVVVQALLDRELLTLRRDARGTRLTRARVDGFALLRRLDGWRQQMRDGAWSPDEAAWFGERFAPDLVTPGVLHYVGVGPLARLPLSALRVDRAELGRTQAWVRYERPSRVGPSQPVGQLHGGLALWSREHEGELPAAVHECTDVDPLRAAFATLARTRQAFASPAPVHFACHAKGGRVDDSDALLTCEDGTLSVAELGAARVRSPLVYLSACEAAVGSLVAGEHPLGVAGALLARGAGVVVATQWRLDDAVAPGIAKAFWAGISAGRTPPAALRDAMAADGHPADRWAVLEVHGGDRRPQPSEVRA